MKSVRGSAVAVVGGQWGDEGKGKIVDLISPNFDLVARYQGGHNAGHTVKFGDKQFRVTKVRDLYFPEEHISWRYPELARRFDTSDVEEIFCLDEVSEAPLAVGKKLGKGEGKQCRGQKANDQPGQPGKERLCRKAAKPAPYGA